jgi:hypothetical protein
VQAPNLAKATIGPIQGRARAKSQTARLKAKADEPPGIEQYIKYGQQQAEETID